MRNLSGVTRGRLIRGGDHDPEPANAAANPARLDLLSGVRVPR